MKLESNIEPRVKSARLIITNKEFKSKILIDYPLSEDGWNKIIRVLRNDHYGMNPQKKIKGKKFDWEQDKARRIETPYNAIILNLLGMNDFIYKINAGTYEDKKGLFENYEIKVESIMIDNHREGMSEKQKMQGRITSGGKKVQKTNDEPKTYDNCATGISAEFMKWYENAKKIRKTEKEYIENEN